MKNKLWEKGNYWISTDKSSLDIAYIHRFLSGSYWAENIPLETVQRSIRGSLCFGVFEAGKQIGFARVISDLATFAYLADVFIDEAYRGQGLGKKLIEIIVGHYDLQNLRGFMLSTRDAHDLYRQYGFLPFGDAHRLMVKHQDNINA